MNWQRVQIMIRQDLEATAPSDAAILARFRRIEAEKEAVRAPTWRPYLLGAFAFAACTGALLWVSANGVPFAPEAVKVTKEVWTDRAPVARVTEEKKKEERDVMESSRPSEVTRGPAPALSESSKVAPSPPARPKSVPVTPEAGRLQLAPPAMMEPRWEEVARAMKEGDEERAHDLIVQLRGSSDAETRDNARLADVQMSLEVRDGLRTLSPNKLATLKDLRATGATSSIRASARRLLSQIESSGEPGEEGLSSSEDKPTSTSP